MKKQRVLIAGGGTGGHLTPARAIVEELETRDLLEAVCFAGTRQGIEAVKVPQWGYPLEFIWISGFQRRLTMSNLLFPLKLIVSLFQAARLIRRFRPTLVVGTGGYVSGPVLYMATRRGLPTLIQEQNSYPGVTTRLLAKRVNKVHLSFENSRKYFSRQDNLELSGNPVRTAFLAGNREQALAKFGLSAERKTIVITGGSQGAQAINSALLNILGKLLADDSVQLLWSAGKYDYKKVAVQCATYGERVQVLEFIDDMPAAYAAGDLAIGRAGALTLAELAVAGLPAVLIPLPSAAANHQFHNARELHESGAAQMIEQKKLTPVLFQETVQSILNDSECLDRMRTAMKKASKPEATQKIVDSLLTLAE